MKKHAIIIGENNGEVGIDVLDKLEAAGFTVCNSMRMLTASNQVKVFEIYESGVIGNMSCDYDERLSERTILWPSYVLEHAEELDGAKKPREIPPEGYRLVTDEEREGNSYPECDAMWSTDAYTWAISDSATGWDGCASWAWAVPEGYTFPELFEVPPEGYRLVTVAEMLTYKQPAEALFCWHGPWGNYGSGNFDPPCDYANYAVPEGYTFSKPETIVMVDGKPYSESTLKNALRAYID
jgi:hypothetical protein